MNATEGRIVHYVLYPERKGEEPKHRPAIVVRDWKEPSGSCNLQVFLDGTNDRVDHWEEVPHPSATECSLGIAWRTSVTYNESMVPGTWHWPEGAPLPKAPPASAEAEEEVDRS